MLRPKEILKAYRKGGFSFKQVLTMDPLVDEALKFEKEGSFEKAALLWNRLYNNKYRRLKGGLNLLRLYRLGKITLDYPPILEALKSEFPDKINPWLESAQIAYAKEDFLLAFTDFMHVVRFRDDIPSVLNKLINSAQELGRVDEVYPLIKSAFKKHYKDEAITKVFLRLAMRVQDQELRQEAVVFLADKTPDELALIAPNMLKLFRVILESDLQIIRDGEKTPIDLENRSQALEDPKAVTANWFENPFSKLMAEAMHKTEGVPRKKSFKKLLFVSHSNWNFMQAIVESFEKEEGIEVRCLELQHFKAGNDCSLEVLMSRRMFNFDEKWEIPGPTTYWKELLNWADVVYVEWANRAAAWISWILPPEKKLVVRIHSYEAFTHFPLFINWGNVDVLSGVAPHILAYVNDLARIDTYKTHIQLVPNLNYHEEVVLEKSLETSCSLGMIGYNNKNKNPIMALQILLQIKERGIATKLYLMGHPFPEEAANEIEAEYANRFFKIIQQNGLEENVEYIPFTSNIDEGIKRFNFILSCSEREGTHESVIQAMLRGTIPVVRKWPILGQYASVEKIYDKQWIFKDVEEMLEFVLASVQNNKIDELRAKARGEAESNYHFNAVWRIIKQQVIN